MARVSDLDLEDLMKKARAATDGDWDADEGSVYDDAGAPIATTIPSCNQDAEFIAAACPATVFAMAEEIMRCRDVH